MSKKTTPPAFPGDSDLSSSVDPPSWREEPSWKKEVAGRTPQDVLADREVSVRKKIDMLLALGAYDEIALLDEVDVEENRREWMEGEAHYTCTSYVFGKGNYVQWVKEGSDYKHPEGYYEVETPCENDIVFYFHDGSPQHVGIYDGDNMMKSKMGEGHVYRHPIDSVPTFYGEPRFFRKNQ